MTSFVGVKSLGKQLGKGAGKALGTIETAAQNMSNALDPFNNLQNSKGQIPFWSTGARSYIRLGGNALGICTEIRWEISYVDNPIYTIDTPHAWDIDIGQASITATLNNIMDPTKGPEADGLFHTMNSAIHQPLIELQVLDAIGTSLFFARGMFTRVQSGIARGQVSNYSASFRGIAYQHYVSQVFQPYGIAGQLSSFVSGLKGLASSLTGGIL